MTWFTRNDGDNAEAAPDLNGAGHGSHMPLTTDAAGWTWRNPLNALPLAIVAMVVLAVARLLG